MRQSSLALLLGFSACSKAEHTISIIKQDAAVDERDAQTAGDADTPDAALDGALDGSSGDGGVSYAADAGQDEDAGPRSGPFDPLQDCEVVAEQSEYAADVLFGDETGFAITPGTTGFGVAFQSDSCGGISLMPVAALGAYPEPTKLFDSCSAVAHGVSLVHVSDGYRLGWIDNVPGSAELQTLQLSDKLGAPAKLYRTQLTDNTRRELAPVMENIANTDYSAWIELDPTTRARSVMLQAADGSGDARTVVRADAGYAPTRLALAALGQDGGALAFVSEQEKPGIWLVPLDSQGDPRQSPVLLSDAVTTNQNVDIATRSEDGGAAVYSVDLGGRYEVRFRRLGTEGEFLSGDVKVATFPLQGRDASIARLGGGYIVAFRSMNAATDTRGEIRLTFISREGNLERDSAGRVTTYPIAEASVTGGRVSVRVSRDGQLLVSFLDVKDGKPQLRLLRKRLDCAL